MAAVAQQLLFLHDVRAALYIYIGLYDRDRLLCWISNISIGREEEEGLADNEHHSECGDTGVL